MLRLFQKMHSHLGHPPGLLGEEVTTAILETPVSQISELISHPFPLGAIVTWRTPFSRLILLKMIQKLT